MRYGPPKQDNRLSQNVRQNHKVPHRNHEKLESGIDTWRKNLAEVKIQKVIFQEDSQSPLLFVIAMMSLTHILRKCTRGHKLHKSQEKINHLIYMDDPKLFA